MHLSLAIYQDAFYLVSTCQCCCYCLRQVSADVLLLIAAVLLLGRCFPIHLCTSYHLYWHIAKCYPSGSVDAVREGELCSVYGGGGCCCGCHCTWHTDSMVTTVCVSGGALC